LKKITTLLLTLSLASGVAHAAIQNVNYKIKSGDSLYKIATKNNTTVNSIRKANNLKKGAILKVGKVIKVPKVVPASKAKPVITADYRIQKGDTLYSIAHKHKTTVYKIRKANELQKNAVLKIGNVLKVPQNNKSLRYTSIKKKASATKLASSLSNSNLETINLKKGETKKASTFAFNDIFTSKSKSKNVVPDKCQKITSVAKTKLGKRYVWGASGKQNTFDCSSFTKFVYKKNGIDIPRTSINQSKFGKYVKRDELRKGDLIFFDTSKRRRGYVNHVGIYIGDNKFIHASSAKKKVVITSLNKSFYSNRYKGARRPS
jgi:cell wall-associated NlpC family hydrolase